jgi:hypothetical protein
MGFAAHVDLAWQAPTTNEDGSPLSDLAGYLVYYGTQSGTYSSTLDVGNMTSHTISISDQEALGNTYYFAVTALDTSGNESSFSNEVPHYFSPGTSPEVCNGVDDDGDGSIDEGCATYYLDADVDGYGNPAIWVSEMSQPGGYVTDSNDCDDTRSGVHPGAQETCNGIDDDCNGTTDEGCSTYYLDNDGDGYGDPGDWVVDMQQPTGHVTDNTDCDDTRSAVYPGAMEICNDIDDNCNSLVDEGLTQTFYPDQDGDGYGITSGSVEECSEPSGYASVAGDCDDTQNGVNPAAAEICNGWDDNCDGTVDEGCGAYYRDADGDGYGDQSSVVYDDTPPPGYVEQSTDCNDSNPAINPGAAETCNDTDDNCNGIQDEGCFTYYRDSDGDSYGDPGQWLVDLNQPSGYVSDNSDCTDSDPAVHPGASEICNGIDDNCDGSADDGCGAYYRDADSDGYGDPNVSVSDLLQPPGYVGNWTDCNDLDSLVNPGAMENCTDLLDNDCDGLADSTDADCFSSGPNTPAGLSVTVQPLDPITGADFVQVTFEEVTYSGDTRLGISQNGPKPPSGYKVSNPHSTFDLSTTALFNGLIETCVDYNGLHFDNEKKMKVFHRFDQDGDGIGDTWEDVTTSHDTDGNIICGVADSFSTFGVFETAEAVENPIEDPYRALGEASGSGGCFIATAAYGSYLDPHVKTLRWFRDNYLLTNSFGKQFVRTYYRLSPPAARWMSEHARVKSAVRLLLFPFVGMAWLFLNAGTEAGLLVLGLICVLMTFGLRRGYGRWHRRQGGVRRA